MRVNELDTQRWVMVWNLLDVKPLPKPVEIYIKYNHFQ